jgi:hypothetical protein
MDFSKLHFNESDKLTGPENYLIWSHQVMQIFKRYKLWHLIHGDAARAQPSWEETADSTPQTSNVARPDPTRSRPALSTVDSTPEAGTVARPEPQLPWPSLTGTRPDIQATTDLITLEENIETCHDILTFTVHHTLIATLRGFGEDPKLVWQRLQQQFQSAAEQRKCNLCEQLNSLCMSEGTTV